MSERKSSVEVTAVRKGNVEVSASHSHFSLVLTGDGRVMAFGHNSDGQLGDGTTTDHHSPVEVTALGGGNAEVSAGYDHSLVLTGDGRVMAFGHNSDGQLGDGTTSDRHSPVEVTALGGGNAEVSASHSHFSLVLTGDGRVMAFGHNYDGQLGDGTTTNRHSPVEVTALGGGNAEVSAGFDHSLVLKEVQHYHRWPFCFCER
eukprot:COSAG02_NODE_16587_length_1072_cov_3.795478_1_plen_202_part_10